GLELRPDPPGPPGPADCVAGRGRLRHGLDLGRPAGGRRDETRQVLVRSVPAGSRAGSLMAFTVVPTALDGVVIIEAPVFADARGFFRESWHQARYAEAGLPPFVQDNVSQSSRDTLRGLHAQEPFGQGKLVQVL